MTPIEAVTKQIIALLDKGVKPWQCSWNQGACLPVNYIGKPYQGINVIMLWLSQSENQFEYNQWLTFKQAVDLGGKVAKGAKGTQIVRYGQITKTDDNGDDLTVGFLKNFTVFNVAQITGLPEHYYLVSESSKPTNQPIPIIDHFIESIPHEISLGGNRACYIPLLDSIAIPKLESFINSDAFYGTYLHELAHWTGHKSRLNRNFEGKRARNDIAFEELIAELTASFLCAKFNIVSTLEGHANYIGSWLKHLKDDRRYFYDAVKEAEKAFNHLCEIADINGYLSDMQDDDTSIAA